jgi:hypothetical protein
MSTGNTYIQDLFSQQAIALVILFVLVSSPEAYRMTDSIIGRHGYVNVAVHGLLMVALAQYVLPYFKATSPVIGRTGWRSQPVDSRL